MADHDRERDLTPEAASVVAAAQAAALDDTLWPAWAEQAVRYIGGAGGTLFVIDGATGALHRMLPLWKSDRIESEYFEHFWQTDPLVGVVARSTKSAILGNADHLDESDPATAEYMRWYRGVGGFDEHVLAVTPLGDTSFRAGITVHKDTGAGPFSRKQREALAAVFPGMARAMSLGFHNSALLEEGYWLGVRAMADPDAVFLLDSEGRMIRMNPAAERLVAEGDGLGLLAGRLWSSQPAVADRLAGMIAHAVRDSDARSGAVLIERPSGRQSLATTINPLPRERRWLAPFQAAALVRITGNGVPVDRFSAVACELFGLTAREAELSHRLCEGHSLESCAAVLGITMGTCRVHVRNILIKTRTSRQGELIALLLRVTR